MDSAEIIDAADPYSNIVHAITGTRVALKKVAHSQTWNLPSVLPFPTELIGVLAEAHKLLEHAHEVARTHATAHVWPHRDHLRKQAQLERAFANAPTPEHPK